MFPSCSVTGKPQTNTITSSHPQPIKHHNESWYFEFEFLRKTRSGRAVAEEPSDEIVTQRHGLVGLPRQNLPASLPKRKRKHDTEKFVPVWFTNKDTSVIPSCFFFLVCRLGFGKGKPSYQIRTFIFGNNKVRVGVCELRESKLSLSLSPIVPCALAYRKPIN